MKTQTLQDFQEGQRRKAQAWEEQRLGRIKGHAVVGAVVFAGFQLVFGLLGLDMVGAIAGAVIGAPVGAAVGWWVSSRHQDLVGGAVTGAAFTAAVVAVWALAQGGLSGFSFAAVLGNAAVSGGIPGVFIAYHCQQDRC